MKFQCPCCGYYTLPERGGYEICHVCFWKDDDARDIYGEPVQKKHWVQIMSSWDKREKIL